MDPLWVIVEGPDGAGKSYIAKECAHILASHGNSAPERPCVLQKLSYNSPRDDYVYTPLMLTNATHMHVVQDRGVLSGPVYEPIMRGDLDRIFWLDELLDEAAQHKPAVIYVTAGVAILQERLEKRGDDYVNSDQLKSICHGYEDVLENWLEMGGTYTTVDTTWDFPDRLRLELLLSVLAAQDR